jgi:peptidoglycan/xylan/chitin deacetylase (PgdA/CDA1 family)
MRLAVALALCTLAACRTPVDELDGAFYAWDGRSLHCSVEIDDRAGISLEQIEAGMDRAAANGEVLELLVHIPGVSITLDRFEQVLAAAVARDLPFVTTTDILRGTPRAAVALMFDDWHTRIWVDTMPLLDKYGAKVTIFVARYDGTNTAMHDELAQLAAAGHDIEAHGLLHQRGPVVVEEQGLRTYLDDEVLPSIDALRADGYEVLSYAYPFGAHTSEIDRAILDSGIELVRTLAKTNELRANPCRL